MNRPRVLVTRSSHQGSELAARLVSLGLEPILIPAIELAEPSSFAALDEALQRLGASTGVGNRAGPGSLVPRGGPDDFDWILFTSANAVEAFGRRLNVGPEGALQGLQARLKRHQPSTAGGEPLRIAAIGPATARALEEIGLAASLVPPTAVAESLADTLLPHARRPDGSPARFLLVRAEVARDHVPEALCAAGAEVTVAPAYRTVVPLASAAQLRELLEEPEHWPEAITFTSSSTARNFQALLEVSGLTLPAGIRRISIGPITSSTLREIDLPPHAEAAEATVRALADAVALAIQALRNRG